MYRANIYSGDWDCGKKDSVMYDRKDWKGIKDKIDNKETGQNTQGFDFIGPFSPWRWGWLPFQFSLWETVSSVFTPLRD